VLGAAIVVLVAAGVALWLRRPPEVEPFGLYRIDISFESELVGREVHQIVIAPEDTDPAGLVVLFHGRGSSPEGMLSEEMFAALEDLGPDAPAILLVDGGESSYLHDRDDGDWGSYVVVEAIPKAIEALDTNFERIAIGGISMGGFGALDLAHLYPNRWCAVGAHSPAIFRTFEDSAAGAFDDAADFARHDFFAIVDQHPEGFRGKPIRIDVGDDDPFASAAADFADALEESGADVEFSQSPGGHDENYWWAQMHTYIGFYAEALDSC
jgi:enterochelin esterase-like enzyme